ncbi:ethyl acetate hydrolase-like [Glandiceps talaboti]
MSQQGEKVEEYLVTDKSKYKLTDETRQYLQIIKDAKRGGQKPYSELGVEGARASSRKSKKFLAGEVDFDGEIRNVNVPVPDFEEGIPVRIYNPTGLSENPPIFIYFHGGGGVVGSRDGVDTLCRRISSQGSFVIVNVEYRMAPEYTYPVYGNDAINVTKWVMQNKSTVGGGEQSIVGVGGDSHGGNTAVIASHEVKGLDYQVLIYPCVDFNQTYPSHTEFAAGPILDKPIINWFMDNLFTNKEDRSDKFGSCIFRDQSSFVDQPPSLMIIAECDPLRDEGFAYAEKLKSAGVPVETLLMKGTVHAYFSLPALFKDTCKTSYDKVVQFIQSRNA